MHCALYTAREIKKHQTHEEKPYHNANPVSCLFFFFFSFSRAFLFSYFLVIGFSSRYLLNYHDMKRDSQSIAMTQETERANIQWIQFTHITLNGIGMQHNIRKYRKNSAYRSFLFILMENIMSNYVTYTFVFEMVVCGASKVMYLNLKLKFLS